MKIKTICLLDILKLIIMILAIALAAHGCGDIDERLSQLKNPNERIRKNAATALGKLKDPKAVEPLISVLREDEAAIVRCAAAEAVGRLGDQRALPALIRSLREDKAGSVRVAAAEAFINFEPLHSIEALKEALVQDHDPAVRQASVKILGELQGKNAVNTLIRCLGDDPAYEVRAMAAETLGNIGAPVACAALASALKHDVKIARKTSDALAQIGGNDAFQQLCLALKHKNDEVRSSAARALGALGDPRAVKPLVDCLKDKHWEVSLRAKQSLRKISSKKTIYDLVPGLTHYRINEDIAELLYDLDWKPETSEEKIHLLVAKKKGRSLRREWEQTKEVLLKDIVSHEYACVQNALNAFIGIGRPEIVPVLIEKLETEGTKTMALAYLNCAQKDLREAAVTWAEKNGYQIVSRPGTSSLTWGRW